MVKIVHDRRRARRAARRRRATRRRQRTSVAAAASAPSVRRAVSAPGAFRRTSCETKGARSAGNSGSLSTLPCTAMSAGVRSAMAPAAMPPAGPAIVAAVSTSAEIVTAAASASMMRAASIGGAGDHAEQHDRSGEVWQGSARAVRWCRRSPTPTRGREALRRARPRGPRPGRRAHQDRVLGHGRAVMERTPQKTPAASAAARNSMPQAGGRMTINNDCLRASLPLAASVFIRYDLLTFCTLLKASFPLRQRLCRRSRSPPFAHFSNSVFRTPFRRHVLALRRSRPVSRSSTERFHMADFPWADSPCASRMGAPLRSSVLPA